MAGKTPPPGILRTRNSPSQSPTLQRRRSVHFQPPPELGRMLAENDLSGLESFITHMRNQTGASLVTWLNMLQDNISALKPKMEQFVLAVLSIHWTGENPVVVSSYKHFLANLISAHGFYIKPVMLLLVQSLCFKNGIRGGDAPSHEEVENVHSALLAMLQVAPLGAKQCLLTHCKEAMPYILTENLELHTAYVRNTLRIMDYFKASEDRLLVLRLIIDRLVQLDAYLPKINEVEEEESDSEDEEEDEMFDLEADPQPEAKKAKIVLTDTDIARQNLDSGMEALFLYIEGQCRQKNARTLYLELINVFETHILTTYATGHVQYAIFYFLSLEQSYTGSFLDWLWKKFLNPNTPGILRQSTMAYIASLVARAKYVDLSGAKACLERIVNWIHSYIATRETGRDKRLIVDIKAHGPFYSACQSALYIFAFRHLEFVENPALLSFLRGLNFSTIVTCKLNPLRVCLPPVVKNFSAIARHYQLAYCDTIIERNNRINLPVVGNLSQINSGDVSSLAKPVLLDSFFPFDPYMLKESEKYVKDHYRVYNGATIEDSDSEDEDEILVSMEDDDNAMKDDDLLAQLTATTPKEGAASSALIANFLYGTSPGFKV